MGFVPRRMLIGYVGLRQSRTPCLLLCKINTYCKYETRHVKLLLASSDTKTKQMTPDVVYTVPLAHSCFSMNASRFFYIWHSCSCSVGNDRKGKGLWEVTGKNSTNSRRKAWISILWVLLLTLFKHVKKVKEKFQNTVSVLLGLAKLGPDERLVYVIIILFLSLTWEICSKAKHYVSGHGGCRIIESGGWWGGRSQQNKK